MELTSRPESAGELFKSRHLALIVSIGMIQVRC